jgi:RimJ/RimL family protein N-acetyltransferase
MTAHRPAPAVLTGRFVQLFPLTHAHLPELFNAIAHEIVFASGYGGGPAAYRGTLAGFVDWAVEYLPWTVGNIFGVRIKGGPHDGQLVGTTTLGDFSEAREHAHLGWTAYDPRVWGTQVNAEAKLLVLGHAFESGFGRVKIQADAMNERSRAAITGIGATFEGITRREAQRADGSWRDTAIFSVIIDDWPRVQEILNERLDPFDGRPVLFRTPPAAPNQVRTAS